MVSFAEYIILQRNEKASYNRSPFTIYCNIEQNDVVCFVFLLYGAVRTYLQSTLPTPSKIHVSYGQVVCFSSSVLRLGFSTEDFTASLEAVEVRSSESSSKVLRNTP